MAGTTTDPERQPYQVVARRFRPTRLDEVVGQEATVELLRGALSSGRVPHAFLFSGSRGVGKTTLARILARALNCEAGPTAAPCDTCRACTTILGGTNPDVIEIDAASHNLVDDIRELRDRVGLASMGSRYKVYILDEVHMLTRSAFNAFLKTLEEPPRGVVFVLATTELLKVPETIRSRCQVYLFRRVDEGDIARRLRMICDREQVGIPDDVLGEIAASSRGGMRDAEGALEALLPIAREQAGAFDLAAYRRLTHRTGFDAVVGAVDSMLQGNAAAALRFAADAVGCGADERELIGEVLDVLRVLLLLRVDGEETPLVPQSGRTRERLCALARAADADRLEAMIRAGLQARDRVRLLEDRRLVLELALLAMARAGTLPQLAELVDAVRTGAPPPAAPASAPSPAVSKPVEAPPTSRLGGGDLRSRLLGRLADAQPLLAQTVEQCRVSGPDARGTVHLELQTDRKLHRDRLAKEGVQADLRTALRDVLGREVSLSIGGPAAGSGPPSAAAAEGSRAAPEPSAPERGGRPTPGPSVRKVVERFDGQILDDDDAR